MDYSTLTVSHIGVNDNDAVYNNKDGSRAVMAANARLNIGDTGIGLDCVLYGKALPDGSVEFYASLPRKGVRFPDKAVKEAMGDIVEDAIATWDGYPAAEARAVAILSNLRPANVPVKKASPFRKARLISGQVTVSETPVQTTQAGQPVSTAPQGESVLNQGDTVLAQADKAKADAVLAQAKAQKAR